MKLLLGLLLALSVSAKAATFTETNAELFKIPLLVDIEASVVIPFSRPMAWGIYNPSDPAERVYFSEFTTSATGQLFYPSAATLPVGGGLVGIFVETPWRIYYSESKLNPSCFDYIKAVIIDGQPAMIFGVVDFNQNLRMLAGLYNVAPVPLPGSGLLFGFSFIALALMKRKKV